MPTSILPTTPCAAATSCGRRRSRRRTTKGIPSVGLPDLRAGGVGLICATIFCEPAADGKPRIRARRTRRMPPRPDNSHWYQRRRRRAVPVRHHGRRGADGRPPRAPAPTPPSARPSCCWKGRTRCVRRPTCGRSSTPACGSSASPGGAPATPAAPARPGRSRPRASRWCASWTASASSTTLAPGRGIVLATARRQRRPGDRLAFQLPGHRPHRPATVRRHGPHGLPPRRRGRDQLLRQVPAPAAEYGKRRATLADVVRHVRHFCDLAGDAQHVGLGTDMDGGLGRDEIPVEIRTSRRPAARGRGAVGGGIRRRRRAGDHG